MRTSSLPERHRRTRTDRLPRIRRSMPPESPLYAPRSHARRRARPSSTIVGRHGCRHRCARRPDGPRLRRIPERLASGTEVAGVDVGRLTSARRSRTGVALRAAVHRSRRVRRRLVLARVRREPTGIQPDWGGAVAAAGRAGDGFGPLRGLRRIRARVFGAEVLPRLAVSNAALEYALDQIAADVNRPRRAPRSSVAACVSRSFRSRTEAASTVTPRPSWWFGRSARSSGRPALWPSP